MKLIKTSVERQHNEKMNNKLEKIFVGNVTVKVLLFILKFYYIEYEDRTVQM